MRNAQLVSHVLSRVYLDNRVYLSLEEAEAIRAQWDEIPEMVLVRLLDSMSVAARYAFLATLPTQRYDWWINRCLASERSLGIAAEADFVLAGIQDGQALGDFGLFLEGYFTRAYPEVLLAIAQRVILDFSNLKIPIQTPASFSQHAKCHLYYARIVEIFPDSQIQGHAALLRQFVLGVIALPDTAWVMRVLAQLPVGVLRIVMSAVREGERDATVSYRNGCVRVHKDIVAHLDQPEYDMVKVAYWVG